MYAQLSLLVIHEVRKLSQCDIYNTRVSFHAFINSKPKLSLFIT